MQFNSSLKCSAQHVTMYNMVNYLWHVRLCFCLSLSVSSITATQNVVNGFREFLQGTRNSVDQIVCIQNSKSRMCALFNIAK